MKFTTQDGIVFILPPLTDDNAFSSSTANGLLQFTIPPIDTVWSGQEYLNIPNTNGVYTVKISVLTTDMNGNPIEIACVSCSSCCTVQYNINYTPTIIEPFGTAFPGQEIEVIATDIHTTPESQNYYVNYMRVDQLLGALITDDYSEGSQFPDIQSDITFIQESISPAQ